MMATCVSEIIGAIVTRLNVSTPDKPAGVEVVTSRVRPSPTSGTLIQVAVFPLSDRAEGDATLQRSRTVGISRRLLSVAVECRRSGTDAQNETVREWVHRQMTRDSNLGIEYVTNIIEGDVEWVELSDANADYSYALSEYTIDYVRQRNTLARE